MFGVKNKDAFLVRVWPVSEAKFHRSDFKATSATLWSTLLGVRESDHLCLRSMLGPRHETPLSLRLSATPGLWNSLRIRGALACVHFIAGKSCALIWLDCSWVNLLCVVSGLDTCACRGKWDHSMTVYNCCK